MSYTLLSEVTRAARKAHRCIWCWQLIKPGEKYIDERSVLDGDEAQVELVRTLVTQGRQVLSVEIVSTGLEERFMRMTEGRTN